MTRAAALAVLLLAAAWGWRASAPARAARLLASGRAEYAAKRYKQAAAALLKCLDLTERRPDDPTFIGCVDVLEQGKEHFGKIDNEVYPEGIPRVRFISVLLPTEGLKGEALRKVRVENMYEAFLDVQEMGKAPDCRRMILCRLNRAARRRDLLAAEAFFPPSERVVGVSENMSNFNRRVEVRFADGRTLTVDTPY